MELLLLEPVFKQMIWGGSRLKDDFGYDIPGDNTGECWAISAHPHGDCTIKNTEYKGKTLSWLWENHRELFGNVQGDRFPLLIKIIDAKADLSIQVHPDDAYAAEHENGSLGKMECWYILDAKEGGTIVIGHNAKNHEEVEEMIRGKRWKEFIREIPVKKGDHVKGKVVVMADYGAFVEIAPGVEGLIHVSEMSWSQHLRSANDFMKVGDDVEAVILTLDRAERKMSLGIKQLKADPWECIETKFPIGSKHVAKVRNFTNFGIFVELEEGVDGLIHISDLSWTKKIKHPSEFTSVGATIDVVVLEIDKENRRLSLGHKQLEKNPWDEYETIYTPGSVHKGTIVEMMDKGAVVALAEGGEGFATPKHLTKEDGSMAKKGEELDFKVIEFVKETKRIILSHSRTFEEGKDEPIAKPAHKRGGNGGRKNETPAINNVAAGTSLGDIDALAKLKAQMEGKA